jgi:hypothetical protein
MATTLPCRGTITAYVSCREISFLSQSNPPIILKEFYTNELAEAYLWHLHSIMSVFNTNNQGAEMERNSDL